MKKTLIILLTVLLLMLFPTASSAFDPPKESKNNESAAKLPIEDVNRLFIVDMLSGYTAKPIKEHYGISLPWQLEFAKIIDAELICEHAFINIFCAVCRFHRTILNQTNLKSHHLYHRFQHGSKAVSLQH